MKGAKLSITLLVVLTLLGWGPWESTGPEGGDLNALVQSPTNASELWSLSGTNPTQVVHSTDAGLNWEIQSSFTSGTPYDLIITADGNLVAVGSSRTWHSTNGGESWAMHSQTNTYYYDAVAHPTNAGELFCAGYKYDGSWKMVFLHSTNNGISFTSTFMPITATYSYGRCITVSQSDPSIILVGGYGYTSTDATYEPAVFRSTNGGATFTNVTPAAATSDYYFYGLSINPTNPDLMLSGSMYNMYRSTNGGNSWTNVGSQYYNFRMAFSQADNNLIFAGGSNRGYRSTNGGVSWSSMTTGLSGSDIQWVVPSWDNVSNVYTTSSAGFFRSTNGGNSWATSNSGLAVGKVLAMAESQGWMFMNIEDMGVYKAPLTGSMNWEEVTTPLACGDFCDICADGAGTLLALEGSG